MLCANLAKSDLPDRVKLIEKDVDLYLEEGARGRALEDLRSAIHNEESERREGEDWSIAGEYVHKRTRNQHPRVDCCPAKQLPQSALRSTR